MSAIRPMEERLCKHCSEKFMADMYDIKRGFGNFCSRSCNIAYSNKHRISKGVSYTKCVCSECKKEFNKLTKQLKKNKSGLVFCCVDCSEKSRKNGYYNKYLSKKLLESYGSIEKRLDRHKHRKIAVDNTESPLDFKCSDCGYCKIIDILEVHHIDNNHNNNSINNLTFLCPTCHRIKHRNYNIIKKTKKMLSNSGLIKY